MKEKHVKMKKSYNDKIFDIINVLLMCILVVIFVWPLWFIVIASFSDPNEVWLGHEAGRKTARYLLSFPFLLYNFYNFTFLSVMIH